MPYTKTTWTDRVVAKPMTFTFQSNGDGTTTLVPSEGTITSVGTSITAVTMNNLESQYDKAMTDVALTYVKLTGNQTITGDLTLTSGADTSPLTLINDNGQLLFVNDATENSIQSLIGNGSASRPFTIEGLNGANISNFNVRADNSNFFGNISITKASQNLILKGTAVGNSNNAYLELQDSGGTRAGFFGKTSSASATIGVWSDIGDIVVRGTTNVNLNITGSTVLSVSSGGVSVTGTVATTGTISIISGVSGTTLAQFKNTVDDGYVRVVTTASNNFIQSGNNAFTSSKNLQITGYNGTSMPVLSVYADNTFLSGTLTVNQGGTTSNLGSSAFTHLLLKKATMKSWTLQASATGSLIFYPSATADLQDWVTANAFTLGTDGTLNARILSENAVALSSKYSPLASPTFTGTLTAPTINATTSLQISGTPLSNIYVDKTLSSLQTLTGNLTAPTINGSTTIQEMGLSLTQRYVRLDGTNQMTGDFTIAKQYPSKIWSDTDATYPNTYAITGYQNKLSFRWGANSSANEVMNVNSGGLTVIGSILMMGGNFIKVADANGNTVNLVSTQVGDGTGIGVALQSGGKMVIGAGESATTVMNDASTGIGSVEAMYMTSDNDVMIWSNVQSGVANKNEFKFDKNAVATINGVTVASDQIGTSIWTGAALLTTDITGLKDITTCPNGWQLEFRNTTGTAYISYAYIHKSCSKGSALLVECGNTQNTNYCKKVTGVASNNTTLTSSASNSTGDAAFRNLSNIRVW